MLGVRSETCKLGNKQQIKLIIKYSNYVPIVCKHNEVHEILTAITCLTLLSLQFLGDN